MARLAEEQLYPYKPDVVLPPGETLAEVLESSGMTQAELAKRTQLSPKHVNQIVRGVAPITADTAILLERATHVPARVWNNLEVAFRDFESRREEETELAEDVGWLEELPVKQLIDRGWLERGSTPVDQVRKVCQFFGVANRAAWETLWHKPTAYRKSRAFTSDPGAVAAWLRIGELLSAEIETERYDRSRFESLLNDIRAMTCESDPKKWWPELQEKCAAVGVAVVAEPETKGARINGATRWLSGSKALIQLSLRHKWSDIFWFTFFHEAGHLLIHTKKETFINDKGAHSGVEEEADAFASKVLIPRNVEPVLADLKTVNDVRSFAADIGVAPGIVVGRLQHDGRWPFNRGNELKQRFEFVES